MAHAPIFALPCRFRGEAIAHIGGQRGDRAIELPTWTHESVLHVSVDDVEPVQDAVCLGVVEKRRADAE